MINGKIEAINISTKKGTIKTPVEKAVIDKKGLVGDAHSGTLNREISLLSKISVDGFMEKSERTIKPGEFAENLLIGGLDLKTVYLLDKFKIGKVLLEVTQIGKKCHGTNCAIFQETGDCVMPKEGLFARVLKTGEIKTGDKIELVKKNIKIKIITLSDRASAGIYEDLSGKKIDELTAGFFQDKKWQTQIIKTIIADNKKLLKKEIEKAVKDKTDIIFTTGGTGLGTKDFTVDVVKKLSEKEIKGIMEFIRNKYGSVNPNALLSASFACLIKKTAVFCLPGSVKAVSEYMEEILKILEHSILMVHDLSH